MHHLFSIVKLWKGIDFIRTKSGTSLKDKKYFCKVFDLAWLKIYSTLKKSILPSLGEKTIILKYPYMHVHYNIVDVTPYRNTFQLKEVPEIEINTIPQFNHIVQQHCFPAKKSVWTRNQCLSQLPESETSKFSFSTITLQLTSQYKLLQLYNS